MSATPLATTFTVGKQYKSMYNGGTYVYKEAIPRQTAWICDESDGVPKMVEEAIGPQLILMVTMEGVVVSTPTRAYIELPNPVDEGLAILATLKKPERLERIRNVRQKLHRTKGDLARKAVKLQTELTATIAEIQTANKLMKELDEEEDDLEKAS